MKYGAIATGSNESLDTAKHIFKEGGNAFDAAIGAVFTSMTSEFALTSAGGGGVLLGINNNSNPILYDFFVNCPNFNNQNANFKKISVNFGKTIQDFFIGEGSIAIPGNIAGLLKAHYENGVLPLSTILEPAIHYAKNGVTISSYQSYINSLVKPILLLTKDGKNLFTKNNVFLKEGDNFSNKNFSDFLNQINRYGADFFYNGDGADLIYNTFKSKSYINIDDLNNYKVIKRRPLSFKFKNYQAYTNPAPSYGGTLIAFLFNLLNASKKIDNLNIVELVKAMEITSIARSEFTTNPQDEFEISKILNDEIFDDFLNQFINNDFSQNQNKLSGFGSTTHISVLDVEGNAVSITTTNGEGSGHFISEFGIMMNNMLGEEDLNPFGFHKWKSIRRLPSMISPIIINKNNIPKLILGSGGSNRIRSANIQVIINHLIKGMSLKESIENPRLHLEDNNLFYEPHIDLKNYNSLANYNKINFDQKNVFFGGVNAVNTNEAVGDSRRGCIGEIF